MKTTRRLALAALTAAFLAAADAQAASFIIDIGSPPEDFEHTTPPEDQPGWAPWWGNDVFGEQPGYVGAQLLFTGVAGQRYWFSVEFVGFEAAWDDTLQTAGGDILNKTGQPGTLAFQWVATGGADTVPFSFLVQRDDQLPDSSVTNGFNPGIGLGLPNFFLTIANQDETGGTDLLSGTVVWLALDDSGAGPDVDHDDWVGLVRVTPVPEPASIALLGGGLIAVMARLRRRLRTRTASGRRKLEGRQTRA